MGQQMGAAACGNHTIVFRFNFPLIDACWSRRSNCTLCHIKQVHSLKNQFLLVSVPARKISFHSCMWSPLMDVTAITKERCLVIRRCDVRIALLLGGSFLPVLPIYGKCVLKALPYWLLSLCPSITALKIANGINLMLWAVFQNVDLSSECLGVYAAWLSHPCLPTPPTAVVAIPALPFVSCRTATCIQ